jgi:hypothetical protein
VSFLFFFFVLLTTEPCRSQIKDMMRRGFSRGGAVGARGAFTNDQLLAQSKQGKKEKVALGLLTADSDDEAEGGAAAANEQDEEENELDLAIRLRHQASNDAYEHYSSEEDEEEEADGAQQIYIFLIWTILFQATAVVCVSVV